MAGNGNWGDHMRLPNVLGFGGPNGWHLMYIHSYIPISLMMCPSAPPYSAANPQTAPSVGYNDYGYRYNTVSMDNVPWMEDPGLIYTARPWIRRSDFNWRMLFAGAGSYRRNGVMLEVNIVNVGHRNFKWSHVDGGNVARHDGSGRWFWPLSGAIMYFDNGGWWPTPGYRVNYNYLDRHVRAEQST